MSRPALNPESTVSGIIVDSNTQQRVIPQSTRADGTVRKERKVKPGFTPAEDVTRFRSSRQLEAEARDKRGPPGSTSHSLLTPSPALQAAKAGLSKSQKQNLKKKEQKATSAGGGAATNGNGNGIQSQVSKGKKKLQEEEAPDDWDNDNEEVEEVKSGDDREKEKKSIEKEEGESPEDQAKKIRSLSKKLKAAELLKEKNESSLLPEQKIKVDSIEELRKELESLGVKEDAK